MILVIVGSILSVTLLLGFVRVLTTPLTRVVGAMKSIISSSDLSARVPVPSATRSGRCRKPLTSWSVSWSAGLTLFTTVKRAVAELVPILEQYLITRSIQRPEVDSIVIQGR